MLLLTHMVLFSLGAGSQMTKSQRFFAELDNGTFDFQFPRGELPVFNHLLQDPTYDSSELVDLPVDFIAEYDFKDQ